ncbi:MAG: PIG-L family deacetylase [Bryobacterales bacterium]|nr:PIG-L family deacetylase [Bryobacterales bacterium]
MRILAIHAHPDDVEILAGGTLVLLARAGHQITIATMTPGDCGSAELPPEEIAAIRRQEARNSAARIGADYFCLELRDLAVFNDGPSRRTVTEALRRARPEIVITASPVDYMCDHEAASMLVRDACFAAPARNYATASPVLEAIPHLYFTDPLAGRDRDDCPVWADFYVDVSSAFEEKKAMLAEHRSQREWLFKHHGIDDYLGSMEAWTREAGSKAGLEMAEGFRRYKGHAYPQSPLLEELLAPCVRRASGGN